MTTADVFLAAKLDENRESVRAVIHREEQAKLLAEEMQHVDISGSPYEAMSAGLVLELCAREGLTDAASWEPEQRIAALEVLRQRRQREAEAAAGGPVTVVVDRLERAVQLPPPKVPKPRAAPKLKVDQLPPSANGVYRVVKDGRAYLNGSPVDFRAGKRIDQGYARHLQAMLDCGIELRPEVPVGGDDLGDAAETIAALTAERDAALARVSQLEAELTKLTLDRDIVAAERDLAQGQLAEAQGEIAKLSMGGGKAPEALDDGEDDAGGDETASSEADTVPPPNRARRGRKPQGG